MNGKSIRKTQVLKDLKSNNDTLKFLLPVLSAHGIIDEDILIEGFKGVYLQDANRSDLNDFLLIRYKPSKSDEYANIDAKIGLLGGFRGDYDVNDDIVYIVDIKDAFEDVLKKFKAGEYSQFSTEHKQRVAKFWQLSDDANDPLSGVLYKTPVGEEQYQRLPLEIQNLTAENELWPIPVIVDETIQK